MYTNRRVFDAHCHEEFTYASCDRNPIHVDRVAARRTHVGTQVVHGVHALLWALDCLAQSSLFGPALNELKAQFLRPIYLEDEVILQISASTNSVRIRLSVGSEEVVAITLTHQTKHPISTLELSSIPSESLSPPRIPFAPTLDAMAGIAGVLSFGHDVSKLVTMFPAAALAFGSSRLAALATASCLVGMVVPGLHSMFSGLHLSLESVAPEPAAAITYKVLSVGQRFRLIRIGISGPGIIGFLETINRPGPVKQVGMDVAAAAVKPGEFSRARALIIGGSRGLGELTAKLIAAGGGTVMITYATGKSDAESVLSEIITAGRQCQILAFDVLSDAEAQLSMIPAPPTHIYYFATPPIALRKGSFFDVARFDEFSRFYLEGFYKVAMACARLNPSGVSLFYPSSTFVESRPASMTEYAMVKAAGEVLCNDLERSVTGIRIISRRLPRLPTDQTSSVVSFQGVDPLQAVLPIVREMHGV